MLSPYNKGLFRRAISQCGVALSPWALQKNPMAVLKKVHNSIRFGSNSFSILSPPLFLLMFLIVQIARKVGCWRTDENEMIACLKMSDPVGLTMAGKIDVMLLLGKGENMDLDVFL